MPNLRGKNLPVAAIRYLFNYDPETGVVTRKATGSTGTKNSSGRLLFDVDGKQYLNHRIAFALFYGRWPKVYLDHKNGDFSDNRIGNLREATHEENARNGSRWKSNTSGHLGVCWHAQRQRWTAQIHTRGKNHYLGLFEDIEEAVAARKAAEAKLFGSFSSYASRGEALNKP